MDKPMRKMLHAVLVLILLRPTGSSLSYTDFSEKGLLQNHGVLPSEVHELLALDGKSSAEGPHMVCGPLDELHAMRTRVAAASQHDTATAYMSKASGTGCFLAFMRPQTQAALSRAAAGWTMQPLPSLLKIHPSVLSFVKDVEDDTLPLLGASDPNRPGRPSRHHSSHAHAQRHNRRPPASPRAEDDAPLGSGGLGDRPSGEFLRPMEHELSIEFVRTFVKASPDKMMREALAGIIADIPRVAGGALLQSRGGRGPVRVWGKMLERHVFGDSARRALARCAVTAVESYSHSLLVPGASTLGLPCLLALVQAASLHPAVLRVTLTPAPTLANFEARGVIQGGLMDNEPYRESGLDGTGQVCGVADSGVNDLSCFFVDDSRAYPTVTTNRSGVVEPLRRKVVQYVAHADALDEEGGHGTHVCGTIAGAPASPAQEFSHMSGMAPRAKLAFFDIGVTHRDYLKLPAVGDIFDSAYRAGARVHTNSWGNLGGLYGQMSYDVDLYAYQHPEFMIVFAAGNSGDLGPKSIISPGNAKNTLSVGAAQTRTPLSDDARTYAAGNTALAYFSSIGPTFDGRLKPDIVAPGDFIQSAYSGNPDVLQAALDAGPSWNGHESCGSHQMSGTSMAAPAAAGTALLIRQFFMDKAFWASTCSHALAKCRGGAFVPSGYLVKAVFLHSGRGIARYSDPLADSFFTTLESFELPGPPDNFQGYGQIYLPNVLPLKSKRGLSPALQLAVWDDLSLAEHSTLSLDISVDASDVGPSGPIKVTLAWYDPPSSVGSSASLLLHDLDLAVHAPNGDLFLGNAGSTAFRLPSWRADGDNSPAANATMDAEFLDRHTDAANPNEQVLILFPSCVQRRVYLSAHPSAAPTAGPTPSPSPAPSAAPSASTESPTAAPTGSPVSVASPAPSASSTDAPSAATLTQPADRSRSLHATAEGQYRVESVCVYRVYVHANTLSEAARQTFALVVTAPKTAVISAPVAASNWIRTEKPFETFAPTPAFTVQAMSFRSTLAGTYFEKYPLTVSSCTTLTKLDVSLSFAHLGSPEAWPSNMELTIVTPGGDAVAVGGADSSLGLATKITEWPDSWISTADGAYTASINVAVAGLAGPGDWQVYVMNSWSASGAVQYNASLTLDFSSSEAAGSSTCAPTPVPTPFTTATPSHAPSSSSSAKPPDSFLHTHQIRFRDVALGVSEQEEDAARDTAPHLHADTMAHNTPVLLESFNFTGTLEKIALSLDASAHHVDTRGSNSWLFTITVTDSRGLQVQVGGFEWVAQRDRFYVRRWPDAWVGKDSFGRRWVSVRDVQAAGLQGCRSPPAHRRLASSAFLSFAPAVCPLPIRSSSHRGLDVWYVDPATNVDYWLPVGPGGDPHEKDKKHSYGSLPPPTSAPTARPSDSFTDRAWEEAAAGGALPPHRRDDWTVNVMMGYPYGLRAPVNFSGSVTLAFRTMVRQDGAVPWDSRRIFGDDAWDGSSTLWLPPDDFSNQETSAPSLAPSRRPSLPTAAPTAESDDAGGAAGGGGSHHHHRDRGDGDDGGKSPTVPAPDPAPAPSQQPPTDDGDVHDHHGGSKHGDGKKPSAVDKISPVDELMRHHIIGRIFVGLAVTWGVIIAVLLACSDLCAPLQRWAAACLRSAVRLVCPAAWWAALGTGAEDESLLSTGAFLEDRAEGAAGGGHGRPPRPSGGRDARRYGSINPDEI